MFFLHDMSLSSSSSIKKKNSIVENSSSQKASVGQIPTHPPQSTQIDGTKLGVLSTIVIVSTGQISTHFVHSENLLTARVQEARSKLRPITHYSQVMPTARLYIQNHLI